MAGPRLSRARPAGGRTMYLRVTRGRFDPAHHAELLRLAQEIAAATERLPGCRRVQIGLDQAAGRLAAVSSWETAAQAGFSREVLGRLAARLQALGVQLSPPEIYELAAPPGESPAEGMTWVNPVAMRA